MMNEEILTSLKNSIARGESLQVAAKILINSGYNAQEVFEASKFVGSGSFTIPQTAHEEHLAIPNQRGFFHNLRTKFSSHKSKNRPKKELKSEINELNKKSEPKPEDIFPKSAKVQETVEKIKEEIIKEPLPLVIPNQPQAPIGDSNLNKEEVKISLSDFKEDYIFPKEIKPKKPKPSYTKEIILFLILLILVGVLVGVIIFREKILAYFSV